MAEIISKEEVDKWIKVKGKIRGLGLKINADFVLKEKGEEGLKKLEETMAELGYPIKYREVKPFDFYPFGLNVLTLLAMQRLFNFGNEKFQEMGILAAKSSILLKIYLAYFFTFTSGNAKRAAQEISKAWRKYSTVGDLKFIKIDEKEKLMVVRLENFRFLPIHCQALIGTVSTISQMAVKTKVTCEETKCVHRGDEYCEFLVKW